METIQETLNLMVDAIKEEKARIIEDLYSFQKEAHLFSSVKEASAYNLALRQFADKLQSEIDS